MAKQIPPRKRNTRSNNPLTNPSSDQEVQHSVDPENRDERIIITGIVGDITPEYSLDGFTPVMSVELDASRGVASEDIEVDSNLLAQVVFSDGTVWCGYVGDLPEIYTQMGISRGAGGSMKLPELLTSTSDGRGDGGVFRRLVNVFRPEAMSYTAHTIALKVDRNIMAAPGLYTVDASFQLLPLKDGAILSGTVLLLLHGTLSSTKGSFGDMTTGGMWEAIYSKYDHIIALEHHTISETPLKNARDVLQALPPGLSVDILSQSRGGLIGDVLTRCDYRNDHPGYSSDERAILVREDKTLGVLVDELNGLAKEKRLTVRRFIRVASPSGGTSVLGQRMDIFLNAFLNITGLVFGVGVTPVYQAVREFIMEVLSHRFKASDMPGMWSMVPSSAYQRVNNMQHDYHTEVFVIAGDGKAGGKITNSLLVIFTNLYYRAPNDFVVDTASMNKGVSGPSGIQYFLSNTNKTNHFGYFRNEDSRWALQYAFRMVNNGEESPFSDVGGDKDSSRGIGLDLVMKRYSTNKVSGTRPIVIILPGIMGSTLCDNVDDIWLSIPRISAGAFVNKLNINATNIGTSGVMEKYYRKIGEFMSLNYDVEVFPFDWRKDLTESARLLAAELKRCLSFGKPVQVIAHSMGGLVMKQLMIKEKSTWHSFCQSSSNRLILLGTPWLGSHLIMEVLTGHSSKVKLLGLLDKIHDREQIMSTAAGFPGVIQLLPMTDEGFGTSVFWENFRPYTNHLAVPPSHMFDLYNNYKQETAGFRMDEAHLDNVFYIAGHDETTSSYKIEWKFLQGKRLVFRSTDAGDGSVTWKLGIPPELKRSNLYYSEITHGELANKQIIIDTIMDIFLSGKSSRLPQTEPGSRGIQQEGIVPEFDFIPNNDDELVDALFQGKIGRREAKPQTEPLQVSVYHADLKYSSHPVLVGHFLNDGLYSAEKSLDSYLGNKLSERLRLGYYPGNIGECEITYQSESRPKGALVAGLGLADELTSYRLSLTVESAIIKYAFFFRDNYSRSENKRVASGISTVLVGSSFAGIPINECLRAILSGIQRANERMVQLNIGLQLIRQVEFVDYYEDLAQQCYSILKDFERKSDDFNIEVALFRKGPGMRRRLTLGDTSSWWRTFNTVTNFDRLTGRPSGFTFSLTSGRARIEQGGVTTDLKLVEYLAKEYSHKNDWNPRLSKTMFELLIPNDFKNIIRNQSNMVWKLDEYAAQFPWELFHDYNDITNAHREKPAFVNTGMIRQLITEDFRRNPTVVTEDKALVIGDPDYSGTVFSQLQGAEEEARVIGKKLVEDNFEVRSMIHSRAGDIITELFSDKYKIIHIAAHGVYGEVAVNDSKEFKAGVVLGNDVYLEASMINQLSTIPEFIFINCCYSGDMTGLDEKYFKERSALAANIGTQLVRMGVKAVIVAGWAVHDGAALTFSTELYDRMLSGFEFGEAVLSARRKCYDKHPDYNTWGAYQCYGDYFYKLTGKSSMRVADAPFVTESHAIIELQNEISLISGRKVDKPIHMRILEGLKARVDAGNVSSGAVKELFANAYALLGEYKVAVELYSKLREVEAADFSVSSLEQYCSLRGKIILEDFKAGRGTDEAGIERLIEDMRLIDLIGNTSERKALKGSLYKRLSYIRKEDAKKKRSCLGLMKYFFGEAFCLMRSMEEADRVYSLTNYLLAAYLEKGRIEWKDIQKLGIQGYSEVIEMLNGYADRLKSDSEKYKDYYRANALAKIYLVRMLYIDKQESLDQEITIYRKALMDSLVSFANLKQILGEVEFLDYITGMLPKKDKKKIEALIKVKVDVASLLT